ncbi:MAG: hypothetical protein KF862_01505 [Chitinophagaceae bacterium]|nr:hypothetical protein [Chitinophagaceae bacterium]
MNLPKYQLSSSPELSSYEFISEGHKGLIPKRIQFTLVNHQGVYNLAFGDKDPVTGEIDDHTISNNGDSEKVLSTVVSAVFAFLDQHPDAWIYASGSTATRTRLYQMGISRFLDDISENLDIYGQIGDQWYPFERNKPYEAFLTKRKFS